MIRNEWALLVRQPLVWMSTLFMPGFAFLLALGTHRDEVIAALQLQMLEMTLLLMALPILLGALAPVTFLRDHTFHVRELVGATPLSPFKRQLARFCALCGLLLVLLVISHIVLAVTVMQKLHVEYAFLSSSLWILMMLTLPSVLFGTALAAWVCKRFSSRSVVYVLFATLWLGYMMLASMTGSPIMAGSAVVSDGLLFAMRLLDPYGITALLEQYNLGRPDLTVDAILIANRLIYLSFALLMFMLAARLPESPAKRPPEKSPSVKPKQEHTGQGRLVPVSLHIHLVSGIAQTAGFHLRVLLKDNLTKLLLSGWLLLIFTESTGGMAFAEPYSILLPTSIDAFNRIAWDVLPVGGTALMLLWSWQVCWRNRQVGFAEFVSAAPVSSFAMAIGQYVTLLIMLVLLLLLTGTGVFVAEAFINSQVLPQHYFYQIVLSFFPLALMTALFVAMHTISSKPLVAFGLILIILALKLSPLSRVLDITHPMWNIAGTPLQAPDLFWGFQASMTTYLPFALFWFVTVSAILGLAVQHSHRGTGLPSLRNPRPTIPTILLLLLSTGSGIWLHQAINVERPIMTLADRAKWRADYEEAYLHWAIIPQPVITDLDATIDIFPHKGFADIHVKMVLKNDHHVAIDSVLIGGYGAVRYTSITLDNATLKTKDTSLNQRVFELNKPLMPGDSVALHVGLRHERRYLWPAKLHHIIRPEFTYLRGAPILPVVGFHPDYRLRDKTRRLKHGLSALDARPPSDQFAASSDLEGSYQWVNMRTVVSTHATHQAVTQGKLKKTWRNHGRRYFEFETHAPLRNLPAWFSVPYKPIAEKVGDVSLEIYSPTHGAPAKMNLLAMKDTIQWFEQHIHPYRGQKLSMLAIPNLGPTGYALPQLILINHKVGFRAFPEDKAGFDQRYRRAVHETAHQWFGHDIGNGVQADRAFLVESMAKYIELVMIEKRFGKAAKDALVDYEYRQYQMGQARSNQVTNALVDATENVDQYSRATIVFDKLRAHIGDKVIIKSLQKLWRAHGYPNSPATSMDFVRSLLEEVNQQDKDIVTRLLLGRDKSDWLWKQPDSKPDN